MLSNALRLALLNAGLGLGLSDGGSASIPNMFAPTAHRRGRGTGSTKRGPGRRHSQGDNYHSSNVSPRSSVWCTPRAARYHAACTEGRGAA